jgi:hypothetical protein
MAVSAYHNLGQNRTVVNDGMPFFRYSRDILETAIKGPLFQEVSEHFVILRKGRYPHDHGWFYQTHRLKPLQVVEPQEYLDLLSKTKTWPKKGLVKVDLSKDPVYGVTYSVDAEKGKAGVVYFAKLGEMTFDAESKKVHRLVAHQLKTFENETGELSEVELKNKALDFNQLFQNQDILPIHEKDFRISQYLVPNGQSSEAMQ